MRTKKTMLDRNQADVLIHRNLKDAGCSARMIERFFQLEREGKTREQFQLLADQRASLLRKVHDSQSRIDCLDFLVYSMKRGQHRGRTVPRPGRDERLQ